MTRAKTKDVEPDENLYPEVQFCSTGSTLLDKVLGGGWAEGRVINIVGDKSSGKTLLAIEACANWAIKHGAHTICYVEAEAAFNRVYAATMGMPDGTNYVEDVHTVEQLDANLSKWLIEQNGPNLYIVDSLDALSSDAEMDREAGDPTYGTEKAKALSTLFRKRIAELKARQTTVIIISQIRDNIGARFGETKKRSGGRSLDFYASQIVWLAEIKKLKRTVTRVERVVGIQVRAQCKKNKVGQPFREANFTVMFNYGVDDEVSMIDWLKEQKIDDIGGETLEAMGKQLVQAKAAADREQRTGIRNKLVDAVTFRWAEIEAALKPTLSKY